MRKQTASNPYAASLTKLNVGQTATFDRGLRAELTTEVKRLNSERNAYEFKQNIGKSGITVTRVVPTNLSDRSKYIDSISNDSLSKALNANNWSKEGVARIFGISARTIGRLIGERGIKAHAAQSGKKAVKSTKSTKNVKSKNVKSKKTR